MATSDTILDPIIPALFERNKQWVSKMLQRDPDFFKESAKDQKPKVLWIGCADSRVPGSVILDCLPGEIFVHRNIANQFRPDDASALPVLQYAVEELGVKHVIVAGHTGCGGAAASIKAARGEVHIDKLTSPLFQFLVPLVRLARELVLGEEIDDMSNKDGLKLLIEENVRRQVDNIVNSETIQKRSKNVTVHGWIYTLHTGYAEEIYALEGPSGPEPQPC